MTLSDRSAVNPLIVACPICRAAPRSDCVWPGSEWWPESTRPASWHLPRGHAAAVHPPTLSPFARGDWRIYEDVPAGRVGQFHVQMIAQPADASVWHRFRRDRRHPELLENEFAGSLAASGRGHRGTFTVRDQWSSPPFSACLTFRFRLPVALRLGVYALALQRDGSLSNERGDLHPEVWTRVARWVAPKLYGLAVELDDLFASAHAHER